MKFVLLYKNQVTGEFETNEVLETEDIKFVGMFLDNLVRAKGKFNKIFWHRDYNDGIWVSNFRWRNDGDIYSIYELVGVTKLD